MHMRAMSGAQKLASQGADVPRGRHLHRRPSVARARRRACRGGLVTAATELDSAKAQPSREPAPLLRSFFNTLFRAYWARCPTAVTALELIQTLTSQSSPILYDHLAFRSFGSSGVGISSLAAFFEDFGYEERDTLEFPKKHLRAVWYSPPSPDLPRIFISEIKVEELTDGAQRILRKYLGRVGGAGNHAALMAATGALPWGAVAWEDFLALERESEYASWTLTNGFNLNHMTVSVHRLAGFSGGIRAVIDEMHKTGIRLSQAGGELKVSEDGGLLQSATAADPVPFKFAEGSTRLVSGSYLEFAERRPLHEFQHLPKDKIGEEHRRDGFEVSNAVSIFDSTRLSIAVPGSLEPGARYRS